MALGIADHVWSIGELVDAALATKTASVGGLFHSSGPFSASIRSDLRFALRKKIAR
jgi:hypothetical protein